MIIVLELSYQYFIYGHKNRTTRQSSTSTSFESSYQYYNLILVVYLCHYTEKNNLSTIFTVWYRKTNIKTGSKIAK